MRLRPLLFSLFASLLAGSADMGSAPVWAQSTNLWQAKASGSFVTLRYGPIDPREKPLFLLSCLNGVSIAVLSIYMDFPETQMGEAITVKLSAGAQSTTVAGETAREDGTGGIYGEAGDIAVKPILEVLREAGPVSMTSGAIGNEMSDKGRAAAVEQFAKDCKLS
jgi:hypothetical protein